MRYTINKRAFQRLLAKNGYVLERRHGSHKIYKNAKNDTISINIDNPNRMVMKRLIGEHNLVA